MIQVNLTSVISFIKKYGIYIVAIVFALLYINSCSNTDVLMAEKKNIETDLEIQKTDHKKLKQESEKIYNQLAEKITDTEKKSAKKDLIIEKQNAEIAKLKKSAEVKSREFETYDNAAFARYFADLYNAPKFVSYNEVSVSFKGDLPKRLANDLLSGQVAKAEVKIKNTIISEMADKINLEKTISESLRGQVEVLKTDLESSENLNETQSLLINKQNEIIKKSTRIKPIPIIIGVGIGVIGTLLLTN